LDAESFAKSQTAEPTAGAQHHDIEWSDVTRAPAREVIIDRLQPPEFYDPQLGDAEIYAAVVFEFHFTPRGLKVKWSVFIFC
jgi:hypothetical protein